MDSFLKRVFDDFRILYSFLALGLICAFWWRRILPSFEFDSFFIPPLATLTLR
jgi:hypothetical protein